MESPKYAENTAGKVVLSLRNDVHRLGVARMLQPLHNVGALVSYENIWDAQAIAAHQSAVLVVTLREMDEQTEVALRFAVERGVKVLVLIDIRDSTVLLTQLAKISSMPLIGLLALDDLDANALFEALEQMSSGEMPLSPNLARNLLAIAHEGAVTANTPRTRMTPREQEVLVLLVDGLSNPQIGRRLGISEHGAKRHVANILGKLDCANRTMAVATALRHGLCPRYTAPAVPAPPS
jgi:DNA-binding NarL/FixJ family response regulator